jgi:hypothetical protein
VLSHRTPSRARVSRPAASAGSGTARYRFVNPLLQPYVAMRGISDGVVRVSDIQPQTGEIATGAVAAALPLPHISEFALAAAEGPLPALEMRTDTRLA